MAGRLSEDEFEARVGQAFASRTHADLATITADIPAAPVAARPARMPDRVVAWGTAVIIAAAALGGALLVGGSALILWAITVTGVLLFTVSVLLNERQERRSRTRRPNPGRLAVGPAGAGLADLPGTRASLRPARKPPTGSPTCALRPNRPAPARPVW